MAWLKKQTRRLLLPWQDGQMHSECWQALLINDTNLLCEHHVVLQAGIFREIYMGYRPGHNHSISRSLAQSMSSTD